MYGPSKTRIHGNRNRKNYHDTCRLPSCHSLTESCHQGNGEASDHFCNRIYWRPRRQAWKGTFRISHVKSGQIRTKEYWDYSRRTVGAVGQLHSTLLQNYGVGYWYCILILCKPPRPRSSASLCTNFGLLLLNLKNRSLSADNIDSTKKDAPDHDLY